MSWLELLQARLGHLIVRASERFTAGTGDRTDLQRINRWRDVQRQLQADRMEMVVSV
jgi:hypothetical protein